MPDSLYQQCANPSLKYWRGRSTQAVLSTSRPIQMKTSLHFEYVMRQKTLPYQRKLSERGIDSCNPLEYYKII